VQARQLLIARRLIEHGVRYVQVWHGEGQPWDNHDDIEVNHRRLAKQCDHAIAALLTDLKDRGLLEETLVVWGGEFGRTPTVELPKEGSNAGKDLRRLKIESMCTICTPPCSSCSALTMRSSLTAGLAATSD
jgi:membrane-anchored protein YejM (alkaline phosphatase superfamily)